MASRASFLLGFFSLLLCACSASDNSTLDIGFVDDEAALFDEGLFLSSGAQHLRAATHSGLLAMDRQGQVVPDLAERWNVTENGSSFVFRLRDGTWPDGSELTAESVRIALQATTRQLRGTSLGFDLAPITQIRAMGGRVVEIRLASAEPDFLQLLAQPELALRPAGQATGPMLMERTNHGALLNMKSPQERGLPEERGWQNYTRSINLLPLDAQQAISRFDEGDLDIVLGGRLGSLPLVDTGPLSRGTVRLDGVVGLFGMQVRRERGVLAEPELREAIAMAIDRQQLVSRFNIGGWTPSARIVSPDLATDGDLVAERWADLSTEELRAQAAARIAVWRAGQGQGSDAPAEGVQVSLLIGDEPGLNILFEELSGQLAAIGITLTRAENIGAADLILIDRIARYGAARWFLNQFNCTLARGLCSEDADFLVAQALDDPNSERRAQLLGEAEEELTAQNVYIPFGSPLRWSLVRGSADGYTDNRWGFHPLQDLAVIPR